jgi:predicted nucleotidyltransferase
VVAGAIRNKVAGELVEWADTPFNLQEHSIIQAWRGSHAHGTYLKPENPLSVDDKDLIAIAVPPAEYVMGIHLWDESNAIKGQWDTLVYEYRKFISLLCKQNPNVLCVLWLDQEFYIKTTSAGRLLIDNRDLFKAREQAYGVFKGYAQGQLKRMTSIAGQGYLGAKRKALVEKFGFDTKNASHLVRLLHQGIEYLETGKLRVNRGGIDRADLLAIKCGAWNLSDILREAERCFQRLDEAYESSPLPEKLDFNKINELAVEVYRTHERSGT